MEQYRNIVYNRHGQMLDVYLPDEPIAQVLLYFHGGGLAGGTKDFQPFMGWLVEHGMAVVSASYRMYPNAKFPVFIEDCADAVQWVKTKFGDKILLAGGSSAGGYLSMMLCFDKRYLERRGLLVSDIHGFVHNAGQATTHFSVLQERGVDSRRLIVDEAAPLYYVGLEKCYPPMLVIVSEDDITGRLEQTKLLIATMKHFACDDGVELRILPGLHVSHDNAFDSDGNSIFGKLILNFGKSITGMK